MRVLLLDNYDSFTYNLKHYIEQTGASVYVFRNDEITIEEAAGYDRIVLSPGPGIPDEAGVLKPLIQALAPVKPILGICLGHQAIAEVFGAELIPMPEVIHGRSSEVQVVADTEPLFRGLPKTFNVGRYHSWVVNPANIPQGLEVTVVDCQKQVMGLRHQIYDVRGLQFHPESVMTPLGLQIILNWVADKK